MSRIALVALALVVAWGGSPADVLGQARPDPIGTFRSSESLGSEYRDMGAAIAQIQTVKRVPFFTMDGHKRMERLSAYGDALKGRDFKTAAGHVSSDFSSGLVKDISTIFLTDVLTRVAKGDDMGKAVSDTFKGLTSKDFLAGNLLGGTLGAAIGSAIPVPILPGLAGQMMGHLPMLAGAMLGTKVGINLVNGRAAFDGIKPLEFVSQAVGSTVGMALGGLLPVPTLGPIVGGAIGGSVGLKVAAWIRERAAKVRGPQILAGLDSTAPSAAAATTPGATPQAPSDSLTGLDTPTLKKMSDGLYREYVQAASGGNQATAAASLATYKQVQDALAGRR